MFTLRVATVVVVMSVLGIRGTWGPGLQAPSSSSVQGQPLFTSFTDLVVLHVMVTDKKGAYVSDLPQEAFGIVEDGRPQAISMFSGEDAPATVGLLIDGSGSMQPVRDLVIAATGAFAESSNPEDELFALAFNENVRAALPPATPFTSDAATLRAALTRTVESRGKTALHDAVARGLEYVTQGKYDRRILIVISDGGDNASSTTFEDVVARTRASNTLVFTIGLFDPVLRDANPKRLREIAEPSGGEAFTPSGATDVAKVLQHIAHDIRHTYTIGYVPNATRDGAFHRIRVVVKSPDGRPLVVRTRTGYLAARRP